MCPPPKNKTKNKVILWSLFVPPCMFFEAGQPVAKRLHPCAKVFVYACCLFFNPLYLWLLIRKRGCVNTGCVCEQATGTVRLQSLVSQGHMGEEHQEIPTNHSPVAMSTNVPWKLFLGGTLLPVHFLFGSSQIAFHFDKLGGVFLLLFILILFQFQLNRKKSILVNHFCICSLYTNVFLCEGTYLFKRLSSLHELDLKVWPFLVRLLLFFLSL